MAGRRPYEMGLAGRVERGSLTLQPAATTPPDPETIMIKKRYKYTVGIDL